MDWNYTNLLSYSCAEERNIIKSTRSHNAPLSIFLWRVFMPMQHNSGFCFVFTCLLSFSLLGSFYSLTHKDSVLTSRTPLNLHLWMVWFHKNWHSKHHRSHLEIFFAAVVEKKSQNTRIYFSGTVMSKWHTLSSLDNVSLLCCSFGSAGLWKPSANNLAFGMSLPFPWKIMYASCSRLLS